MPCWRFSRHQWIGVFEHSADYLPSPLVFVGTVTDWQHIAVVYSNRTPRLYVNGLLIRTGLTSGKTVHPSINLGVAGSGYGYYQGTLDEVRVWSVALDADTLQQWRGYEPYRVIRRTATWSVTGSWMKVRASRRMMPAVKRIPERFRTARRG